jgi:hypothetical protein
MGKYYLIFIFLFLFLGCKLGKGIETGDSKGSDSDSSYFVDSVQLEYPVGSQSNPIVYPREIRINQSEIVRSEIKSSERSGMGQIVYNIPDTMVIYSSYKVTVRISKSESTIDIEKNLNGRVISSTLRVESRMEVKIIDPSGENFRIVPINRERQLIEEREYTQWIFNIIPLKSGKDLKLDLVVSIIIGEDTKEIVYTDKILVKSNPTKQIKSWWERNWHWIIEVMLIPFGIWIWNFFREKLKKKS